MLTGSIDRVDAKKRESEEKLHEVVAYFENAFNERIRESECYDFPIGLFLELKKVVLGYKDGNEKQKYYFYRTFEHIQRVQSWVLYLITNHSIFLNLSIEDCRTLSNSVLKHDASKFSSEQFFAYVEFSWAMKNKEKLNSELQLSFDKAWENHFKVENHHPEKHNGTVMKMTKLEVIEVACDLQAMADEFGEGSCRKYFENVWVKKQSDNFYCDFEWEQAKELIYQVIRCFEEKIVLHEGHE